MGTEAHDTRTVLMDAAEKLLLRHGLAGTTVEAVVEEAGVTKGTFFYHFDSKDELARSLVERYEAHDEDLMAGYMAEAERRSGDPLDQVLIFVRLFEDQMEKLAEPYPGCLFASYCYQNEMFDEKAKETVQRGLLRWRERLADKFGEVLEERTPSADVEPEDLADMLTVIFEGAFVLSKTLAEPQAIARQLRQYRIHLTLLFGEADP